MSNTVATPSTALPYLLAEDPFLIVDPLCGEVRPYQVKVLQHDRVYQGVCVLVGRQHRELLGAIACR
jgi:hypothetical protein